MTDTRVSRRYPLGELRATIQALFRKASLDVEKAQAVADALLDADMMGHSTHGLALVPWYLDALATGSMASAGTIEVVSDRGACVAWKGRRLPGAWLIHRAIDVALERVASHGVVTATIA